MGTKAGIITLNRSFLNWKWFHNPKILSVYLWLLATAFTEDEVYEKEVIPRGSLVTTNMEIAYGCGITIQNARTALASLEKTGEITRESRNHYQIVNIVDFDKYVWTGTPKEVVFHERNYGKDQTD